MIDYIQTIYRRFFRGFTFNAESRKIEPILSQQNVNSLIQLGMNECGYTESYALNLVTKTVANIYDVFQFAHMDTVSSCRLSDLRYYSVVRVYYDGPTLTLLYLEGCRFCLLKDEFHTLEPGDILQCLSYTFSIGREAVFRVVRQGKYIPDEHHVIRISQIENIEIFTPNYLPGYKSNSTHAVTRSVCHIGAWRAVALGDKCFFLPQDLTQEHGVLFNINLRNMTFSLNRDFEQSLYPDYLDVLCSVCEYMEEADIEKRKKTIREGEITPVVLNSNQYALEVKSKAKITL